MTNLCKSSLVSAIIYLSLEHKHVKVVNLICSYVSRKMVLFLHYFSEMELLLDQETFVVL